MTVYTDIKTLKKVWSILKELELQNLLTGGKVEIDMIKVLDALLSESKLNEFCQTVTKSDQDFEELELEEVTKIIADFFTGIAGSLKGLNQLGATTVTAKATK